MAAVVGGMMNVLYQPNKAEPLVLFSVAGLERLGGAGVAIRGGSGPNIALRCNRLGARMVIAISHYAT